MLLAAAALIFPDDITTPLNSTEQYYNLKQSLLNSALELIEMETQLIEKEEWENFEKILNKVDIIVAELKQIDTNFANEKLPADLNTKLSQTLKKITDKKKINIDVYKIKFEAFKKNHLPSSLYNRELANAYFNKIPSRPRFIDTKIQ